MDSIVLTIGGSQITGWKSVEATISMEHLSGSFSLVMSDHSGAEDITPGAACTLSINGSVVITGYVDKVNPKYDKDTHEIHISGRDKAADLIDSSVINPPFQYKGLPIDQIIQRIASPFGINVSKKTDTGETLPTYNIDQGAKAFETIQKLCKGRQCLAISDGKGNIEITRAGANGGATALIEGQNIQSGSAEYDISKRHSKYVVKGQRQGDDNTSIASIAENKAEVEDEFVNRYRPLLVVAPGQANSSDATQRARWEAGTRSGKSRRLTIIVSGWQQAGGSLWQTNTIVPVIAPKLFCNDSLLLCQVKFKMDDNTGQITELTLVSPEAYQGMSGNKLSKKKGSQGALHSQRNPLLGG